MPFYFLFLFFLTMFQLANELIPILDVTIIVLALILIYLLVTRVFFANWVLPRDDELETMQMIQEEKLRQVAELVSENKLLTETIKQAKTDYMKRKINASSYKKIVEDSQERMVQNEARIKFLQQ